MIQILLIVQIIVTILMIVTILLQRNTSDGMGGMGGGGMPSVSTDSAGPLAKLTGYLAAVFLINCLAMAAITSRSHSLEDDIMEELGANSRIPVQMTEPENGSEAVEAPAPDAEAPVEAQGEAGNVQPDAVNENNVLTPEPDTTQAVEPAPVIPVEADTDDSASDPQKLLLNPVSVDDNIADPRAASVAEDPIGALNTNDARPGQ